MSEIPEKYIEVARKIIAACRDAGCRKASGTIEPGWRDPDWTTPIQWTWEQGRHGDANKELRLFATVQTNVELELKP